CFPCALIAVWRPSNFHAVARCRTYATGTPQGSTLATRSSQSKLLSPGSAPTCGDLDFPSERWALSSPAGSSPVGLLQILSGDEEDAKAAKKREQTRDRTKRWRERLKGCKENQSLEKHGDTGIKRKKKGIVGSPSLAPKSTFKPSLLSMQTGWATTSERTFSGTIDIRICYTETYSGRS
ncbi:hypothetical protein EJB05_13752, partial [Eragrostis curvula]